MKILSILFAMTLSLQLISISNAKSPEKYGDLVKIKMETSYGEIELELNHKKAPITVKNFLSYAKKGFYEGTIFHRVIKGFMIQGGGFNKDLERKSVEASIQNEADNGLANEVGTIAMARTGEVHSATAQFFINVNNNTSLNHTSKNPRGYGYAVFGRVTKGMPIINKIKLAKTMQKTPHNNFPVEPILIKKIIILK
jgi:peptidyl-prolyl cis-trans isomerase B (cyclophilin B)